MQHQSERRPAIFVLNDPTAPRLNPELAKEIGLNESLLFLQLEFWLRQSGTLQEDGQYWIYESVTDIQSVFSFWGRATINRIIHSLERQELIQVGNFNKYRYDKTRWITLNRAGIDKLNSIKVFDWWVSQSGTVQAETDIGLFQNGTGSDQNGTRSAQNGTTIPDLSSEKSSEEQRVIAQPATDDSWPGDAPAPQEPTVTPQERHARMKQRLGTDPVVVAANCKAAQDREGQWTVPEHSGLSPACATFKEATGYAPPKAIRDDIDEQVAHEPGRLKFWYDVCHTWVALGWNPRNAKGMLDHYVVGKIPATGGNGARRGGGEAEDVSTTGYRTVPQGSIGW